MTARPTMILIIDENVPEEVAEFFRERGHLVLSVRSWLGTGADDEVIALHGDAVNAVVVTLDRDFKRLSKRAPFGSRLRFRRLGRISLDCQPAHARRRIERLIDYVEFAHEQARGNRDQRLIVEITETSFRVVI